MTTRPPPQLGAAQLRSIHSPLYSLSVFLLSPILSLSILSGITVFLPPALTLAVSLFRSFYCSLSPCHPPPPSLPSSFAPFLPELSATGSSSVRRSIGILHPVPPLTRWRRTKVLTLMFHSRCCLFPTTRTHVYAAR